MSFFIRIFEKYRTEFFGMIAALVLISAGFFIPTFIPDELIEEEGNLQGFQDATWFKTMITVLFIGMGILCFVWLVVIHRLIVHRSKKEYLY